jgi:hypothetical protein
MQACLYVCKWVYSASEIIYTRKIGGKLTEKSNYIDTCVKHKIVYIHSQSTEQCNI